MCHGSNGRTPTVLGRSFYPPAPDLGSPAVQQYSDAGLFVVIKRGIRNTGMPGFGNIHSDEELWGLVSYVRSLRAPSQRQSALAVQQHSK
jgi:mono/diheme cytochrome c family protein